MAGSALRYTWKAVLSSINVENRNQRMSEIISVGTYEVGDIPQSDVTYTFVTEDETTYDLQNGAEIYVFS